MAETNNQRTGTSTQIRNMYSDSISYLNISFFNTNLSFRFYPFLSKDNLGKSRYDTNHGQNTTVNYEGAYALYQMSKDIIEGKIQEANLVIPCAAGASLTFERKMGSSGQLETWISISKNNVMIPFKFQTILQQVKENGQQVTRTIEVGLGVFMKTIDGYLTGINADRHLDKLTDDYIKSQEENNQQGNNNRGYQNNNFRNNGYKKSYNNGGGYKKQYNGPQNPNGNNQQGWGNANQQNMSSYNLPN